MKKIGAFISLIATLIGCVFCLAACGDSSHIPDGMQLVAGGNSLGYYFYAPEEWTVSNTGEIKSAYVARVDTSSVSFAEVHPKDFLPDGANAEDYFFNSYFKKSLEEFPNAPKVANPDGENIIFGKEGEAADKAKKYTFTYEYYDYNAKETFKYGFMQILIKKGDSYYIFTYSASMEKKEGETTYYDYYLGNGDSNSKIMKIINEFRFTQKEGSTVPEEPKRDKDGYLLISDSKLCGFDMYAPESFRLDYSSGIISATHGDGSNITMSEAMGTNENVNAYVLRRLGELESVVSDIKYELMYDENGEPVLDPSGKQVVKYATVKFGNATAANAYEYTFTYNGESYHVYQVIIIDGWALSYKGYVFTYTAKEVNYSLHYDEIQRIIEKVDFE
jgi:hypothetical protein